MDPDPGQYNHQIDFSQPFKIWQISFPTKKNQKFVGLTLIFP